MTPTADLDTLLTALRDGLGARHVLTDPDGLAPYLTESRRLFTGSALAVLRPGSTEEVAFAVRACTQAGVAVVPLGGNTGLTGAGVPRGGVVLSLERVNRLRAVDPVDATITVEAGMILQDVQEAAEAAGMLFPLSYASRGSARIGGGVSTNAGGIAVLAYGNARDLVLGLEVVLADGRVWNGLKALRKDNAGYDLKQLFIGSEGTLGVVTAAVLKLFPRPRSTSVAFVGLASARAALDLFVFLRTRMDRDLTAFEYLPPFALEIVLRHVPGTVRPLDGAHGAYALIEVASARPGCRHGGRTRVGPRAGPGGRADRRRHDRDQRGPRTPRSGACAKAFPRRRPARAPRSSTTSRCRSPACPSSWSGRARPASPRCRA